MSSKSDRDNRSNQLNSNNIAFSSSRSSGGSDDSNDDFGEKGRNAGGVSEVNQHHQVFRHAFRLHFIGMEGQSRNLRFVAESRTILGDAKHGQFECDELAELMFGEIRRQLIIEWHMPLALGVLITEAGRQFEWLTVQYQPGRRGTPQCDHIWHSTLQFTVQNALQRLEARKSEEFEDMGSFEYKEPKSALLFKYRKRIELLLKYIQKTKAIVAK